MHIPDDVTLPQFLFDQHHPLGGEALHSRSPTYFIDDATGRRINGEEVSVCAHLPVRGTVLRLGVGRLQRTASVLTGARRYGRECLGWRTRCIYGGASVSSVHGDGQEQEEVDLTGEQTRHRDCREWGRR